MSNKLESQHVCFVHCSLFVGHPLTLQDSHILGLQLALQIQIHMKLQASCFLQDQACLLSIGTHPAPPHVNIPLQIDNSG